MTTRTPDEHVALVALLRTKPRGLTTPKATQLILEQGSATGAWEAANDDLLSAGSPALDAAATEIADWRSRGLTLVSILDPEYPARLRSIHQAPPFLFAVGDLRSDDMGMSIVGSREADERSQKVAAACADTLVSKRLTVISGLAKGIDTAAHRAALARGGRTVAFIGNGVSAPGYPAGNRDLQSEIADRGLLLSQFWPDDEPHRGSFLMRNASMSGYGLATIVVTASETSGTRAQARMAVEHGRPVILTDRVVEQTQWGKDLVNRPGVHVIAGVRELSAVIDRLRDQESAISSVSDLFARA